MTAPKYILQSTIGNVSRTVVWDTSTPTVIGGKKRYLLAFRDSTLNARELLDRSQLNVTQSPNILSASQEELAGGLDWTFENVKIHLRPVPEFPSLWETQRATGSVYLTETRNGLVYGFEKIDSALTIRSGFRNLITFQLKSPDVLRLNVLREDVKLIENGRVRYLKRGNELDVDISSPVFNFSIVYGHTVWRPSRVIVPEVKIDPTRVVPENQEQKLIARSAAGILSFLVVVIGVMQLIKYFQTNTEEEKTVQEVKIIMKKKAETQAASGSKAAENSGEIQPQSAESAPPPPSLAQASKRARTPRAKLRTLKGANLNSALNNLLKGGVSRFLSQDEVAKPSMPTKSTGAGGALSELAKLAQGLGGGGGVAGPIKGIGGQGNGLGNGVGYGQGDHAKVSGQGTGQVGIDDEGSMVQEGLSREEVARVIHAHLSEVRYCYESSMVHSPSIEGKIQLYFVIDPQGVVKRWPNVQSSTVNDSSLDDCIIRRLVTWKFPKPKGGVNVEVNYPFVFKSLKR